MRCFNCIKKESLLQAGLHTKTVIKFIKKSIELNKAYLSTAPLSPKKTIKLEYQIAQAELLMLHLQGF